MDNYHEYCTGGFSPDDIVISGISGKFPECSSINELKEALLTKKNILLQNNDRFERGALDLPFSSTGTVKNVDKLDIGFFGISAATANNSDPLQRMLLEVSYEAMADAGYEPKSELCGSNIGVYTAACYEDNKDVAIQDPDNQFLASGYLRCMLANRLSHAYDFHGPSFTLDTACSSSFVALWSAYNDIKEGRVPAALVNAGQLCLNPVAQKLFYQAGILSKDCQIRPFDAKANGFVKSESVACFFIQKASDARRAYCTISNVKHKATGFVPEGVYVPSAKQESRLFQEVMRETGITAKDIQYVEAHGTGTPVGDPIEVRAIAAAYCKRRDKPLYTGSVKSNVGHAEPAAGHAGAIKVIIGFETGLIAPNVGFETPNPNIESIMDGNVKIVTEPLPLNADYVPVNCFGFGGSIVQAMFKRNPIEYSTNPEPQSLPRLVLFSGTTEAAVLYVIDYIEQHPELRAEFFALLNKLSFAPHNLKPFRGYSLLQKAQPVHYIKNSLREKRREVWFVMTGMGCQWPGMGLEMMQIKIFADSMRKSAEVMKSKGIDLFELLKKDQKHLVTDRSVTPAFVTICAIQIALIDVLRELEIHPDRIIGHSSGELPCAYADGCLTAEQTILSAYWRGKSVESAGLEAGAMAAVGMTLDEVRRRCPDGIYPACHNSENSVTLSGHKEPVEKFVAELQKENIFARSVNAYSFPFHCKYVWPAAKSLKEALLDFIPNPRPRTERWVSTSYPEEEWNSEDCKVAGAEYFVHNLMSMVLFGDGLKKIPADALTIEIGPHFLLQSILKQSIGSDGVFIGLMKRNDDNNVGFFLESVGKLYAEGLNPKIEKLYEPVKFPVPRNTPMICDLIKWDHSQSFNVPKWKPQSTSFDHVFHVESADSYLLDHFIDGRPLFPATGYIYLAWKALAKKFQKDLEELDVAIEDFKIHKAIILSPTTFHFQVKILNSSGYFEIMEDKTLLASGKVSMLKNMVFLQPEPKMQRSSSTFVSGGDIYNELKIHGYEYGPAFRKLLEISLNGKEGFVEWDGNWISFMDSLLLFFMFTGDLSSFRLPTGALSFKISASQLKNALQDVVEKNLPGLPVSFYSDSNICRTVGLEIRSLQVEVAPKNAKADTCVYEQYLFLPFVHKYKLSDNSSDLEMYMASCNKIINAFRNTTNLNILHGQFKIKNKVDFDIDAYIETANGHHKLLSVLKEMSLLNAISEKDQYEHLVSEYIQNIGKDILNNFLVNDYCLKYMFDIIAENSFKKLSVLEITNNFTPALPLIVEVVEKYSVLKFKKKVLVCDEIEDGDKVNLAEYNIQVCSPGVLASVTEGNRQSVVISAICGSSNEDARQHLELLSSMVETKGFILLFHKSCILPPEIILSSLSDQRINIVPEAVLESWFKKENLTIASKISDKLGGNLYLLRPAAVPEEKVLVRISESDTWLNNLQSTLCNSSKTSWVVCEDNPSSGIIGMINCLRHEPGGDRIRCIFIPEKCKKNAPPKFSFEEKFFQDVLKKDLVMNVYKEGVWGSYRHVKVDKDVNDLEVDYSYINIKRCGDLSTISWMESAMNFKKIPDKSFIHIYYSALNFKDVMLATGKITEQFEEGNSDIDHGILGFEFAGRTKDGERVAGMCSNKGLATATQCYPDICFAIPVDWSMEEAATVPTVYFTCYYALIMRARLLPGESILIHSGAGGIGQAAINIASSMNCEIYTTVGTERKRQFLLENFPNIKPENIGCSRNTTFEKMILERTAGKGVDVVLNSLADEKFLASIRCVAKHGKFVEIGKYDLSMDHKIGLKFFLKNITFHAVFLDELLNGNNTKEKNELMQLLKEGIRNGAVKPLQRTVFSSSEVEKAFRYLGSGTHIGKVIIKIRDEETQKCVIPKLLRQRATPVTYFYPHKMYIVIGGLGGFGIEVSKWLLSKGAKNLVLTTRYGARTPYQHLSIKRWMHAGYNIIVSKRDVSNKDEAEQLIKEVQEIGPVGGIFNSAVVLHDAFLENTTWDEFREVCAPKADATKYLDSISRCLCPDLDHFVCFSSISCGRGNAGQMNYGYANSVMERICEQRLAEGFPGLAIQWGIIGEVGVVHRNMGDDAMIAGVGAQKVKSCLEVLDLSCRLKRPVVCSYVVKDSLTKHGNREDILQQLSRIFGFKDPSEFNSLRNFGEMGVDSMTGIEVKQLLETTCDVTLTIQEILELKIDDVKALVEDVESQKTQTPSSTLVSTMSCISMPKSCLHSHAVEQLNNVQSGAPVFFVDIDSNDLSLLCKLSANINQPVFALLLCKDAPTIDLETLAAWFLERMAQVAQNIFHIVACSSASVVAFEIVLQVQKAGNKCLSMTMLNGLTPLLKISDKEKSSDIDIICDFVENYIPSSKKRILEQLSSMTTLDQKIRSIVEIFTKSSNQEVDRDELTAILNYHVKKIQLLEDYTPKEKICKDILIIEDSYKTLANDVVEIKMTLSEICSGKITIHRIPDICTFTDNSIEKFTSLLKSLQGIQLIG